MDKKVSILVVDDEQDILQTFALTLRSQGYDVDTASDGSMAVLKATTNPPDLILLDVQMPDMSGFDTIARMRKNKTLKHTPIVFLTGMMTRPEDIEAGYALGSTEYWKKPMDMDELIARVRSVLHLAETEAKLRSLQQSFYSMVVHDLRSPLSGVIGYSQFLLDGETHLSEEEIEILRMMEESAQFMLGIIEDLLKLAELESGDIPLDERAFSLESSVQNTLKRFSPQVAQKDITVSIEAESLPQCVADQKRIEEVFVNLLDNAIRFTPAHGSVKVLLGTGPSRPEAAQADQFVIRVVDTGGGMPEEVVKSLFDKNRITHPSSRHKSRRSGLGLAICKQLMDAHNGTIAVASVPGSGTTVTLTLPFKEAPPPKRSVDELIGGFNAFA